MAQTIVRLQTKLMRDYYKDFSKYAKGRLPEKKTAWVTAFTPVEILEALDISYYYPESYAAVIAASGKEQKMLAESEVRYLSRDCCSYSGCFHGCITTEDGPRGIPPKPDILIATNNQCNTLPNWWNLLAAEYNVPLIVLDYPGEAYDRTGAFAYVTKQHKQMIAELEKLSGNKLDMNVLSGLLENSRKSVAAWEDVIGYLPQKKVPPTALFDDITFLITSRCKKETSELYKMMAVTMQDMPKADQTLMPVFWLGYPLWYHPDRYLKELLDGCRIVGANYITWWNLSYEGDDVFEQLFSAYNDTFLNLSLESRNRRLTKIIRDSGAVCAVSLHNKSCKCDFVSARNIRLPQAELEIDMIDREFLDMAKAEKQMQLLKGMVWNL